MPWMRARYAGPVPALPAQAATDRIGLSGWLAVNRGWGLISFVAVAGVGLLVRVHFVRRYGKTERSTGMDPPDEQVSS